MVCPTERADRAITDWTNGERTEDSLRRSIAREVGQAIYWERRALLGHLQTRLSNELWEPDKEAPAPNLPGFHAVLSCMVAIVARQHRDSDTDTCGFEDFKPHRNRIKLSRIFGDSERIRPLRKLDRDLRATSNSYPQACSDCGHNLPAHEGVLEQADGKWSVRHHHGLCPRSPSIREVFFEEQRERD